MLNYFVSGQIVEKWWPLVSAWKRPFFRLWPFFLTLRLWGGQDCIRLHLFDLIMGGCGEAKCSSGPLSTSPPFAYRSFTCYYFQLHLPTPHNNHSVGWGEQYYKGSRRAPEVQEGKGGGERTNQQTDKTLLGVGYERPLMTNNFCQPPHFFCFFQHSTSPLTVSPAGCSIGTTVSTNFTFIHVPIFHYYLYYLPFYPCAQ